MLSKDRLVSLGVGAEAGNSEWNSTAVGCFTPSFKFISTGWKARPPSQQQCPMLSVTCLESRLGRILRDSWPSPQLLFQSSSSGIY